MSLAPRIVVVHRRTELDELIARHGTRGQAVSSSASRGRASTRSTERHTGIQSALATVSAAIPVDWRRAE